MPIPLFLIAAKVAYLLYKNYAEEKPVARPTPTPTPPSPSFKIEKRICLIGGVNSGKSSTGNALLGRQSFKTGISHGVTTITHFENYEQGYQIADTPGLLDADNYEAEVISQARRSKIIVYVCNGQMYENELDFIRRLSNCYLDEHHLLLFANKQDEKEHYMPSWEREKEKGLIKEQVKNWIKAENIAFGASSPKENGIELSPRIEQLKALINKHI